MAQMREWNEQVQHIGTESTTEGLQAPMYNLDPSDFSNLHNSQICAGCSSVYLTSTNWLSKYKYNSTTQFNSSSKEFLEAFLGFAFEVKLEGLFVSIRDERSDERPWAWQYVLAHVA